MLTSMKYEAGSLYLIDQRELPHKEIWLEYNHEQAVADAIVDMVVRGAPAIGCAAAFGVSIGVRRLSHECRGSLPIEAIDQIFSTLQHTRPTAVNLFYALKKMRDTYESHKKLSNEAIVSALEKRAIALFDDDLRTCRLIGKHGADFLGRQYDQLNGLTHCNAGSLATAGYGTALSVFTELFRRGRLGHVFVDETRPWLQGARLTAFEMARAGVPYSIICDSAAAHFMAIQSPKINVVVVGADRIAANGDAANKIGTYSLAIAAKHHGIGFFVAAPISTFDVNLTSGKDIPIEEREHSEVRSCLNQTQIAAEGSSVKNPSFDVTPFELVDGIITEHGVLQQQSEIKEVLSF